MLGRFDHQQPPLGRVNPKVGEDLDAEHLCTLAVDNEIDPLAAQGDGIATGDPNRRAVLLGPFLDHRPDDAGYGHRKIEGVTRSRPQLTAKPDLEPGPYPS